VALIEDTVQDENQHPVGIRIEVADYALDKDDDGRRTRGGPQVVVQASNAFKGALQLIHTCAMQVSTTIHHIPTELRPKEFEVQFAVKIDGKAGAFIAESSAGAQLQVTLKWGEKETH
jgi:hypothetical protein